MFSFPKIKCKEGEKLLEQERAVHIVSTFLLGLKIAMDCLDIDINIRDSDNMSFQYEWFMTCLYHDIGYVYEKRSSENDVRKIASDGINGISDICGNNISIDEQIFKTYPECIVDLYFRKRAECQKKGCIDHGIIGGILLYNGLSNMFNIAWEHRLNKNQITKDSFDACISGRKLHYSTKHFEEYAKAADAIIMHNIWKKTLQEYIAKEFKWRKVRINPKVSCKNNPLCFILCLADTIEPLKRALNTEDTIYFSFTPKLLKIHSDKEKIRKIYEEIKDCEDWLDVNVCKKEEEVSVKICKE